jgi:DNA-binding GntR family transcriptional regulator
MNIKAKRAGGDGTPRKPAAAELSADGVNAQEPLYIQLALLLKKEIADGVYPVGSHLPTEGELCQRFSVGRHTVREATRLLRDERLISTRRGSGSLVLPPRPADSFVLDALSINDLVAYASNMHLSASSASIEVLKGKRAEYARVPKGSEWLVVRGLGVLDGAERPLCWCEHFINAKFARVGRYVAQSKGPLFLMIEELFGQKIEEINQELTAILIPPDLAAPLNMEIGEPAARIRRTYRLTNDEIAQITIHTHPASRFSHKMTLRQRDST